MRRNYTPKELEEMRDAYQAPTPPKGMPTGIPETVAIVEYFDAERPGWGRKQRAELSRAYDSRDTAQSLADWWRDRWMEYAPRTARHGQAVNWVHQHDSWAPYQVDGVDLRKGQIVSVTLVDQRGSRWSAAPADLTVIEPAVHTFDDTVEAYDATQCREDIRDGDVLVIESESVVGIAWTWPFALTEAFGELHILNADPRTYEDGKFAASIPVAEREAARLGVPLVDRTS
ncbi:hypothetical protein ABZS53_15370 [Streptomyces sp. NPDC005499]|uniref:hypothetical protein n=1 Tax=Streptomyces sp. NPDC005499 TaxID=3154883 RepID=UPI0033B80070